MSKTLATLGAGVLLCASQFAHAYLPGSVSGPFYNPEQSGHGISITIATDQRAIAIWHVYNTEGDPLTLYIEGDVKGRRIVGQAYAPEGMRFGDFNKEDVQLPHWGSVDIAFDDCDHATLSWVADDLAYGDGEMPIRRLVQPIGVACTLPVENEIPLGLYETDAYQGFVDEEGVLWGIQRGYFPDGTPNAEIPGRMWVGGGGPISFVATPTRAFVGTPTAGYSTSLKWSSMFWLSWPTHPNNINVNSGSWTDDPDAGYSFVLYVSRDFSPDSPRPVLEAGSARSTRVQPVNAAALAGDYKVPVQEQFFERNGDLHIEPDGSACFAEPEAPDNTCFLEGQITVSNSELGIVEFHLTNTSEPLLPAYFGRGWMADADYGRELVLVGHPDGGKGFGLIAIKQP
ncbi:MAG: hypothetical protein R3F22_09745 [Lysobacteraceae bacterium]